jgi:hypothetical protein
MKKIITIILLVLLIGCSSNGDDEVKMPTPVLLISPSNNDICEEGVPVSQAQSEVLFEWEPGLNANIYELNIKNLSTDVLFKTNVNGNSSKEIIDRGYAYEWTVISINSENSEKAEPEASFRFYLPAQGEENYAPFPAEISFPENNSEIVIETKEVNLYWSGSDPDSDDLEFKIYFGQNHDAVKDRVITPIETLDENLKVNVENGEVYFWLVETSDRQNKSFTQVHQFIVKE